MPDSNSENHIADEIRRLYAKDEKKAETLIEAYLEKNTAMLNGSEKTDFIHKVMEKFHNENTEITSHTSTNMTNALNIDRDILSDILSLLLGNAVFDSELSSSELLERLSQSLNAIFDTLNELVGVIHTSIFGEVNGEETIRQVISINLREGNQIESIERYLGQIKQTFLNTQKAFKASAYEKVNEILTELDPESISESTSGGLKIGPLRKAENYQVFEKKFHKLNKWLESGRFMEEFLREFEKRFQKLSVS